MNSPMKKRMIVVAITLALTGIQAEAAKTNNKDKYKDVMVYGNVTLEQDSMKEWGPWEQFIQPAAGAPVPPPVAAITPDPIPEIREPIIPEEEVASACEPGAPCGYASYRHYGGQEYEYGGGEGGAWDYTSGEGAPAKIDITVDTTDEDPGIDNFQVTPTKARDNYSPVNSVEMEYYNYYSYDVYSEGNDWDDDYNGQDS
ncbi:MAG: hypothetical protein KAR30_07655, partial [Gammaproteobacteria bacterium]|nr:hypothetical protein [Gammaproteobacteria bacterium]